MKICGYIKNSVNEGEGLRNVIFFSGCPFHCKGCHNPESQNPNYGVEFTRNIQEKIIKDFKKNPLLSGITYCGGEPFLNAKEVLEFTKRLKDKIPNINIWSYSGYKFEELINHKDNFKVELLKQIDVLIDGLFIEELKDLSLQFRGSANQRIIDVKESMKQNTTIIKKS